MTTRICSECSNEKRAAPGEWYSGNRCAACYMRHKRNTCPEFRARQAASAKRSYHRNREKALAQQKEYYQRTRGVRIAKAKEYASTDRGRFAELRGSANTRGIVVELTFEQFCAFLREPCVYCKCIPVSAGGYHIDRKDHAKGYTLENSVPCCPECNYDRCDRYSFDEYRAIMSVLELTRGPGCPWHKKD